MSHRRIVASSHLAFALAACVACSQTSNSSDDTSTVSSLDQPLSGSNAKIDNTGVSTPWLGAVGQLRLVGGGGLVCSGTLVTPSVVLTAGHCFNSQPAANPGVFIIPNGPPVGKVPSGSVSNVTSWKRIADESDHPHDVGCAFLSSPVPSVVVSTYPRVFTGDIENGVKKPLLFYPFYIAGFGDIQATGVLVPTNSADGNRRWGSLADGLQIHVDPCGNGPFEGHCNDDWEWELDRISNPQTERGDSGGPLVATDVNGSIIVGVSSGVWSDGAFHDMTAHTAWAPTGAPGGTNNGSWLVKNCLGPDVDEDGFPIPRTTVRPRSAPTRARRLRSVRTRTSSTVTVTESARPVTTALRPCVTRSRRSRPTSRATIPVRATSTVTVAETHATCVRPSARGIPCYRWRPRRTRMATA